MIKILLLTFCFLVLSCSSRTVTFDCYINPTWCAEMKKVEYGYKNYEIMKVDSLNNKITAKFSNKEE